MCFFVLRAEDGIGEGPSSGGLGVVSKRKGVGEEEEEEEVRKETCLLFTTDAADDTISFDIGGRRIL